MSDSERCSKLWKEYLEGNIASKEMQERCCEMLKPQQALKFGMQKFDKCSRPFTRGKE